MTQQHVTRDDKDCMASSVHVSICILICVRVLVPGRMRWLVLGVGGWGGVM